MKQPRLKGYLVATLTITAVVVFAYTVVTASIYDPGDSNIIISSLHTAFARAPVPHAGDPVRFKIPALNIDAAVQQVKVSARNTIGVPTNFTDVGWYIYSPVPGSPGSAIIDGHVDNGLALAGVFKHLSDVKIGNVVDIVTRGGTNLHFMVIQIDSYPYDSTSTDAMVYPEPGSYLRLITCGGTWLPAHRTYDTRLVVTAELML
jgi:hypothetical protein